jgi:branched-chain amino acid transport system ATP-binding protein
MLTVDSISVSYQTVQVLWDISLEVPEGEVVSVIGPNGAGKSTLLKTILGVLHPTSGTITFRGEKISTLSPHSVLQKGICLVPEGRRLFPYMTVLETLELGGWNLTGKKERNQMIGQIFQLFPVLEERKTQNAGTLSGGEQQMLAVGRGIMSKPKLLMLDEPSQGLAPTVVKRIYQVLPELNKHGTTILLVEQNVRRALETSDKGYVLETGRTVMKGDAKSLLANPNIRKAYMGL